MIIAARDALAERLRCMPGVAVYAPWPDEPITDLPAVCVSFETLTRNEITFLLERYSNKQEGNNPPIEFVEKVFDVLTQSVDDAFSRVGEVVQLERRPHSWRVPAGYHLYALAVTINLSEA